MLLLSFLRYIAIEYCNNQLLKARELFSLGLIVDNKHGPLYHAYGNMEMR